MKTKNILIAVLSIGIIVLGVLYYQKCKEITTQTDDVIVKTKMNEKSACDVDSTRVLKDIYPNLINCKNPVICGVSFPEDSLEKIRKMIRDAKELNPCNEIYGYQISLNHVKQMYNAIVEYNDGPENADKVAGIRFYEAVSERMIEGKFRKKADLVMLPYLSSGKDVFLVDTSFIRSPFNMYAHFRPCPRLCGNKKSFIYE
jgi:hypothetical protein